MSWLSEVWHQNSVSVGTLMEGFHFKAMIVVLLIFFFVLIVLGGMLNSKFSSNKLVDHQKIESIWTVFPALILIALAFPSLSLLYKSDEHVSGAYPTKCIGHQWYWTYESPNGDVEAYLGSEGARFLSVTESVYVPSAVSNNFMVTSADVLHSWALPSAGIKLDACPGRINTMETSFDKAGVYYGQCSEICGSNHSMMPIRLETTV